MTKRILLLACTLLLGGCALPVPVQIASWAVDGLLYITTEKTMADHGVSLVAQRDCAMLRVVTEGALCRDDDAPTLVASADPAAPIAVSDVPPQASAQADDNDAALRLAAFETAAGGETIPETLQTARSERVSEDSPIRWQTIRDVALFIEGLIEPGPSEALSDPMPEWTAIAPTVPEDVGWAIREFDVGLLSIDGAARQYADGANIQAIWGGMGEDALRGAGEDTLRDATFIGEADRAPPVWARRAHDPSPAPVRESLSLRGGPGNARKRPPRRGPTPARGRGPPGHRRRRRIGES